MNARIASILLAAAAVPFAAGAADTDAAGPSVVVAAASSSAAPGPGCPGDAGLSSLQRRLLAKYDQDVSQLLQFVWITRTVYQMDRLATAQWAEDYRNSHPAC